MPVFGHNRKVSAHSIQQRHAAAPQVSLVAASAASLAFANNTKSNGSLSAAAAAAALQKHPQPPTNVANATTKRIQRRDSESSNGSSRPGLERRSSLTDRSLRSPSPGREGPVRPSSDAPPMPRLPPNLERTESGRQRAASLEPPLRISSPPPNRQGGRGVSLDRAPRTPTSPKAPGANLPKVTEQTEAPQRSSVNFSRPISPPPAPTSPASPSQHQTGWFAGPVVSGGTPRQSLDSLKPKMTAPLAASEASGIQVALQGAANQPVKKKKKRLLSGGNQGSHLSKGSMDLTGTAVEHSSGPPSPTMSNISDAESSKTPAYTESEGSRASLDSTSDASSTVEHSKKYQTRAGSLLARQPSIVDEAPEFEEQSERANTGRKVEAIPSKSPLDASRVAATSSPVPETECYLSIEPTTPAQNGKAVEQNSSTSSPRAAHFSPAPEFLDGILHAPPARSASPQKSALKHSPSSSVRNASPDFRLANTPSEAGDTATKKKTNRVSFDETPHVLSGLSTSRYASQSPPRPRVVEEPDLDDIMKPRPALPMFGSVRGRKADNEDVKPTGHSNDHLVGGILAQNFPSKESPSDTLSSGDTEKIAHDPNLPLPPDVLTVEGSGDLSDTESEYSFSNREPMASGALSKEPETIAEAVTAMQTSEPKSQPDVKTVAPVEEPIPRRLSHSLGPVPTIAVLPATPAAEEVKEKELFIPGAFPDEDEPTTSSPSIPQIVAVSAPHSQPQGALAILRAAEEDSESDSDNSSVWSDAEENLPDGPGGFASLNAILDSPNPQAVSGLALSKHAPAPIGTESPTIDEVPPSPTTAQWDKHKAYWSSLSEQTKNELEAKAAVVEAENHSQSEYDDSDEELEKPAMVEPTRSATPPPKNMKAPKLESPIAFAPTSVIMKTAKKAEPKLRSSMRVSKAVRDDESPVIAQPKKQPGTKLRLSVRDTQSMSNDESPRMRQSLRTSSKDPQDAKANGERRLRGSVRAAEPMPKNTRGYSGGLEDSKWSAPKQQKATLKKNIEPIPRPTTSSGLKADSKLIGTPSAMPTLRRTGSADSASSFKRSRLRSPDAPVSMRRSMRSAPPAPTSPQRPTSPPKARKSSKFSIRSLSPMGRGDDSHHMRMSMRGAGSDTGVPMLRGQKTEKPEKKTSRFKSPTRLGFGKSKQKKQEASPVSPPTSSSGFKSRFAADSDDEEVTPAKFKSRFADSDDELEDTTPLPKGLAPVRGIPRKKGEEDADSTDLEDSDSERVHVAPPVPTVRDIEQAHSKGLTNGNKPGSILSAGSLRNGDGGLGASKYAPASPGAGRPGSKRRLSWLGLGGKAKGGSQRSSSAPPMHLDAASLLPSHGGEKPKLQRRSTPSGLPDVPEDSAGGANWPLPPPPAIGQDERPNTSDGVDALRKGEARPDVSKRRSTADYIGPGMNRTGSHMSSMDGEGRKRVGFNFENGEPVYSERTGRKKKFGTLRRMFGLND